MSTERTQNGGADPGDPARPIYLDHHSTTPVDPRVLEAMLPTLQGEFGNPASRTHSAGRRAKDRVEAAREQVAAALGASAEEVLFTSGATEANNLALFGVARASRDRRRIVSVATEHPSVLEPLRRLAREGFEVVILPVDRHGHLDPEDLAAALDERTSICSVMAANHEVGTLHDLAPIAALCHERGVLLHTDASQAIGKVPFRSDESGADLVSVSAHKVYGPKGAGALLVRRRSPSIRLEPLFEGGDAERGLRPGTVNVPGVVGMGAALELAERLRETEALRIAALRDRLWDHLEIALEGVHRNGSTRACLPGNLSVSFEYVEEQGLIDGLAGLSVSSGAACASGRSEPSSVLTALGIEQSLARATIRLGLGRSTTQDEVDRAAAEIVEVVGALRDRRPLYRHARRVGAVDKERST